MTAREISLASDPKEIKVRNLFRQRADDYDAKPQALPKSWEDGQLEPQQRVQDLKTGNASLIDIRTATRELAAYPKDPQEARHLWVDARTANLARSQPVIRHTALSPERTARHPRTSEIIFWRSCFA